MMATCSNCKIEKPLEDFHKCKVRKSGRNNKCKACANKASRIYKENNKEKCGEQVKLWKQKNPERHRAHNKKWKDRNPSAVLAMNAKRRAKYRTPCWLTEDDLDLIKWAYEVAKERTDKYGIQFHVDHIIPLQGDKVSGLHVPENLQVITAQENLSKGNKWEDLNEQRN